MVLKSLEENHAKRNKSMIKQKRKGRDFNDRELAGKVRTISNRLALSYLSSLESGDLKGEEKKFAKEVLIKCLGNSLPRISEISGRDGEVLKVAFDSSFDDFARKTEGSS